MRLDRATRSVDLKNQALAKRKANPLFEADFRLSNVDGAMRFENYRWLLIPVMAIHSYLGAGATLARKFGGAYEAYRASVPRWIPRLVPRRPPAP
jgi:hypothetical protein